MDIEERGQVLMRIFCPLMLILGPLFLGILLGGSFKHPEQIGQVSIWGWIFTAGGTLCGVCYVIYYARNEFNWFMKKNGIRNIILFIGIIFVLGILLPQVLERP